MTATEQLIAKQVSDVFPASVDDLPLQDAARRGLIAPLRCSARAACRRDQLRADRRRRLRPGDPREDARPPGAQPGRREPLPRPLRHTPGIVYAAGIDHAYNLATEFRAAGLKAEAVSGKTPPVRLAETLAAYERGEINVLINAQLLAEGWNSPRATVCMHLAPTASKRVYQQRIGRIMRMHPRKEAGIVVDFVPKGATHNERVVSLHSLLDADFYREGARVTPAPRRRSQRRARRSLTPAPWLVPVTPDVRRRIGVIQREWQRIDPKYLDEDEQRYWATIAGRQIRFDERANFVQKLTDRSASKAALEQFLATAAAENPNKRLRTMALQDRVSMRVERADFDDLVTLVSQAPTWERSAPKGSASSSARSPRISPTRRSRSSRAGHGISPARRAKRRIITRRRSTRRPSGCSERSRTPRGHQHEENAARLDEGRARATAAGRRGAARLRRELHPASDEAPRRGARGARHDPGSRARAVREPPGSEARPREPEPPSQTAEAEARRYDSGGAGRRKRPQKHRRRIPRPTRPSRRTSGARSTAERRANARERPDVRVVCEVGRGAVDVDAAGDDHEVRRTAHAVAEVSTRAGVRRSPR